MDVKKWGQRARKPEWRGENYAGDDNEDSIADLSHAVVNVGLSMSAREVTRRETGGGPWLTHFCTRAAS